MESSRKILTPFSLGDLEVHPETLDIIRGGHSSRLEPKIMDLLLYFSENSQKVLSKDLIMKNVWGGTTVVDEALQRAISILRKALGDDKTRPLYIETISKKGYRLILAPTPLDQITPSPLKTKKERGKPSLLVIFAVALFMGISFYLVWTQIIAPEQYAPSVPLPDDG